MATEIERKFLVKGDFLPYVSDAQRIVQGYICTQPGKTVRVRIRGEEGFLTIKGPSDNKGLSRYEFEQQIPLADAEELLKLCESEMIDKVRHLVPAGKHTWEVDVFCGVNDGLVLAEIELAFEDELFDKPDWLGDEVSGDRKYYNSMLTRFPYTEWDANKLNNKHV